MFNFENLELWQKAIVLADVIYSRTRNFPADERFGLTNQMRRSIVSVSSNIAEGSSRSDPGVGGCRCPRGGGKESGSLSNRLLMPTLAMMQSKARFRMVLVAREGALPVRRSTEAGRSLNEHIHLASRDGRAIANTRLPVHALNCRVRYPR